VEARPPSSGLGNMNHLIAIGAVLALVVTTAMPEPVAALDLGKSVKKVSRSVSRTVGSLTGSNNDDDNTSSSSSTSSTSGGTSGTSGTTSGGTTSGGSGLASASASVGKDGVSVKVGSSLLGGTGVTVGALNTTGAAQLGAQVGDTRVGASVLSTRQLATLRIDANPPGTGNVALPGAGGGSTGGGTIGVTPDYVRKLLASLNGTEEKILIQRCAMIARSPKAFDAELVLLCKLVAQLT
jgi:hypothetical protein